MNLAHEPSSANVIDLRTLDATLPDLLLPHGVSQHFAAPLINTDFLAGFMLASAIIFLVSIILILRGKRI